MATLVSLTMRSSARVNMSSTTPLSGLEPAKAMCKKSLEFQHSTHWPFKLSKPTQTTTTTTHPPFNKRLESCHSVRKTYHTSTVGVLTKDESSAFVPPK